MHAIMSLSNATTNMPPFIRTIIHSFVANTTSIWNTHMRTTIMSSKNVGGVYLRVVRRVVASTIAWSVEEGIVVEPLVLKGKTLDHLIIRLDASRQQVLFVGHILQHAEVQFQVSW
jgi:hypothetical protein